MKKHDAREFAWDSFSKTGKIGYYLFYKALSQYGDTYGKDASRCNTQEKRIP
ncbi:MAG: hypothetical protein IJO93_05450 [Clostridia bacterium]|nr:hypothetical protein [Clostridia bacterium]